MKPRLQATTGPCGLALGKSEGDDRDVKEVTGGYAIASKDPEIDTEASPAEDEMSKEEDD